MCEASMQLEWEVSTESWSNSSGYNSSKSIASYTLREQVRQKSWPRVQLMYDEWSKTSNGGGTSQEYIRHLKGGGSYILPRG